jgi:hypothetical protein
MGTLFMGQGCPCLGGGHWWGDKLQTFWIDVHVEIDLLMIQKSEAVANIDWLSRTHFNSLYGIGIIDDEL